MKKCIALMMALLLIVTCFPAKTVKADGGPVITKQPEDVMVHYPEGATFTVEVSDPDAVESYQWYE